MQGWVTWPGSLLVTASCHDNVQHPVKNYKACWEIELLSKWNNRKQTPTHISEIGNLYIQDSGGNEEQNRCINGAFQELEYICLTSYHWKIQCLWWGTQWLGAPEDRISALGNRAMKNTQGRAQEERMENTAKHRRWGHEGHGTCQWVPEEGGRVGPRLYMKRDGS